jgi:hypothetical protein
LFLFKPDLFDIAIAEQISYSQNFIRRPTKTKAVVALDRLSTIDSVSSLKKRF